ncbi:conserved hypothetical protein [Uncinocarpus reesii 1704]|uniref:Zn(2)-C6 fungal-type domain-containing protein n=1 Tax=Uncinocarpus reesii (strain UAMH 1704) TaxID=336963 RepID=C4JFP6_UNCRE|nr:uncharacterized protein UREG_02380 [Uncinocarpus reesii 1704]EEP77531.1 conserved hypothetical protein [Uncinocarpus reesii 1704]
MFHIFEGFENPDKARSQSREGRGKAGKRSSTVRACEQCRRRKIRCDGEQPCEACQWHVEKLSSTVEEYRTVFDKLFPSVPLQSLLNLPREKLLELASNAQSHPESSPVPASASKYSPSAENHVSPLPPDDENLESLQTMPDDTTESQGSSSSDLLATVSDDVNALSLSTKRPSTYLGISSVNAVMRVITWIDPESSQHFSRTSNRQPRSKQEKVAPRDGSGWALPLQAPQRGPFGIFALGSIAAYTANDTSHEGFYLRARHYLSLDTLGNPHLETIQTLALMGGHYLHYISQPNLAHSFMAVALRMAIMLGLHKAFADNHNDASLGNQRKFSIDLRRRIWWSLFCLDTWGYMTLGRPSMGRSGPGITVKLPQYNGTRELALCVLSLVENTRFCKIATQVGDALATSPIVAYSELVGLDDQLVEWFDKLPPVLKDHEPCPDPVLTTRTVMRWRYQSQRILLHRPVLLSYAMRRVPYVALRTEERYAIEKCRMVADETIRDVASTTRLNQMTGWNAVWLLFQATLIPLLGLFIADSTATHPYATLDSCRNQVETAMCALERLESWSPTAKRTLEVVSKILEASQRPRTTVTSSFISGSQASSAAVSLNTPNSSPPVHNMNQVPVLGGTGFQGYQAIAPYMGNTPQQMLDFISWGDNTSIWPSAQEDFYPPPATTVELLGHSEHYLKSLGHSATVTGAREAMYDAGLPPTQNVVRFS